MRLESRISIVVFVVLAIATTLTAQTDSHKMQKPQSAPKAVGVKLQPMNVKPGLWETTTTYSMVGEMPIPASMLARLSPEQRARMEERMKANSAATSRTVTDQSCLTKEDLENADFAENKDQCTQTILSSTGSKAAGTISCNLEGVTVNGSLEIEAVDQEHVKGSSHGTTTGGGHARKVDSIFASKWLGPKCTNH